MFTTLIDAAAAAGLVREGHARPFDCRADLADPAAGRAMFEAGHLPGAVWLDLEHDLSGPPSGAGTCPFPQTGRDDNAGGAAANPSPADPTALDY